ncbi:single-stranded DNA-binding protein [Microlunatus ginsengisoli]|uniref:Single-stranded DNA-binding protein n=1 Tax=Microlunatus ginsengisoli TaxID=363863 RepID=A0ABP7AM85_9ACTN
MNNATFVGNLTADPKLITSRAGSERAVFSIALDEYGRDDDAPPTYVDVTVFSGKRDSFARNVAESLTKGKRVVVIGRASTYRVEAEIDGESKNITKTNFIATAVAPDLRWQSAKVTRVTLDSDADAGGDRTGQASQSGQDEPEKPAHRPGRSGDGDTAARSSAGRSRRTAADDDDF